MKTVVTSASFVKLTNFFLKHGSTEDVVVDNV